MTFLRPQTVFCAHGVAVGRSYMFSLIFGSRLQRERMHICGALSLFIFFSNYPTPQIPAMPAAQKSDLSPPPSVLWNRTFLDCNLKSVQREKQGKGGAHSYFLFLPGITSRCCLVLALYLVLSNMFVWGNVGLYSFLPYRCLLLCINKFDHSPHLTLLHSWRQF